MENISTNDLLKEFNLNGDKWSYKGETPCVIDFYATWCGPCKGIETVLNDLSKEHSNIKFYRVDVEEEYELSRIFSIKSLPTIIFCSKDSQPTIITGTLPKSKLEQYIKGMGKNEILA